MDSKRSIFEKPPPPPPPSAALRREDAISCLPEEVSRENLVITCDKRGCFKIYSLSKKWRYLFSLVYLSFGCKKNERGWKLLADMLKQSPKLETLIIEDLSGYTTGDTSMPPLNQVKVLHILMNHGCNDQELEVLESFVAEFKQLELYRVGVLEDD